nr:PREDICTED: voltage-dependent calcium channel gamma-6 subunit [Latimeria chalumnae]|eukprot:XP_006009727.1 PREDICTED: voltage-dependent calcium channel gamma-6 subunit [Latimeria chalumnae]
MWSNFFMQEENLRGGGRVVRGTSGTGMSDSQEGKIKLAFFVAIVGVTLTVLAVGTEFWVELSTLKENYNVTCEAAHFGLWKLCLKKLRIENVDDQRKSCGPAELPGESNCTYFKFFTTGENTEIFYRTTKKGTLLSLEFNFKNNLFYGLSTPTANPVSPLYCPKVSVPSDPLTLLTFSPAGLLVLISTELFHQSVLWLMDTDSRIPLEYEFSWSFVCAVAAGAILIFGGLCFILLSVPEMCKKPWQACRKKDTGP